MNHDYNDEHNRSMTFESDDKMKSSNIDIKSDSPAVLEWTPKVQVPTSSIEVTDTILSEPVEPKILEWTPKLSVPMDNRTITKRS